MDGMETALVYRDDAVDVYAGPGPILRIVGRRPAPADFEPWAAALRSAAADPGIATVRQAGRASDGRALLVVDAAPLTLAEHLVAAGSVAGAEAVRIGTALAGGLAAAHANGLVHGAVCPSTVVYGERVALAGFDACAPGLAKPPGAPNPFAPADHGQPADVAALASTVYRALGGRPGEIADLYGVPPELTALLRAATAADPAARPTAAQFRDALLALPRPAEGPAPLAVAAALAGADVRPLNDAVVSINLAVAGAAAAGIAATAGVLAGQGASGALSALSTGAGAKAAAAKGMLGLTALKVGAVAVGIAVVAGGVVVGVNAFEGGGGQAAPEIRDPEPPNEDIKGFDWANASYLNFDGTVSTTLVDGEADRYDELSFTELAADPVYADLDGDNDLDAVTLIVTHGGNSEPTWMQIWLWEDGGPVQIPGSVLDRVHCGDMFEDPVLADGKVEVESFARIGMAGGCAGAPEDFVETTLRIEVRDGYPVATAPAFGSVHRCEIAFDESPLPVAAGTVPLVWPADGAPKVGDPGEFTEVAATFADTGLGWSVARLTRADGSVSCGWVPASAVG